MVLISCKTAHHIFSNKVIFANNNVIAHRGAWKKLGFPENSIASLKHAIELQCAGSEFDVRMTADNVLVINHDSHFNNLEIEKTAYADLIKFKLSNGEKLPTLSEYIKEGVENNTSTRLICEIKPSEISKERGQIIATKVVQLVKELNAEYMVAFISFDYDILKKIKELNPLFSTQYLNGVKTPEQLKADGISGLDYHFSIFRDHPEWIESAMKNNITLNAWTVNDNSDFEWLLANNFDYITTNEPELLFERIAQFKASYKDYKLVWSDEFEYVGLPDSTKWNYDIGGHGWGNNEKQFYREKSIENSYVKDGKLHIVALKKDYENSKYTSSRLTTYSRFLIQNGKIEVMAKLPQGKGTWPAIWMLPNTIRTKEEVWPLCGEIDIMEHVGKDPNVIHSSLHTQLYNFWNNNQYTYFDKFEDVFSTFHLYGIEWTPNSIQFFIDNKLFYEAIKGENGKISDNFGWPFEKPYYLILNLAIGGNWGGDIDDTIFPSEMQIDYVRMYQKLNPIN
ncbi:MAG: family 16 glycosylhydrolase [Flavobacteriales bacterium]|nr:family 16 glycosylhydrolase [Flavobacteriales bacterium]NCT16464.1 family 16 glycosylhydrolase [Flavobacteriales bacterium]